MHNRRNIFLLSAIFVFAGVLHLVVPDRYVGIMPAWIPLQLEMVYVSGVAEILGGIGLLIPFVRKAAAIGLIVLLVVVFPANIQMLSNATRDGSSMLHIALLWLRLPLQPLMIVWIYRSAISRSRIAARAQTPG